MPDGRIMVRQAKLPFDVERLDPRLKFILDLTGLTSKEPPLLGMVGGFRIDPLKLAMEEALFRRLPVRTVYNEILRQLGRSSEIPLTSAEVQQIQRFVPIGPRFRTPPPPLPFEPSRPPIPGSPVWPQESPMTEYMRRLLMGARGF